jgi:hypothetical protein
MAAFAVAPPWASLGPDTHPSWTSSSSSSCSMTGAQRPILLDPKLDTLKTSLLHLDSSYYSESDFFDPRR